MIKWMVTVHTSEIDVVSGMSCWTISYTG